MNVIKIEISKLKFMLGDQYCIKIIGHDEKKTEDLIITLWSNTKLEVVRFDNT